MNPELTYEPANTTESGIKMNSHYKVSGFKGGKIYIGDPKSFASVFRKVLARSVTTHNFDDVIKDHVRATFVTDAEYFPDNKNIRRANMVRVGEKLIPMLGTDIDPTKTRDNLQPGQRDHNPLSNPDRVSFQFTVVFKGSKFSESDTCKNRDIPAEIQVVPDWMFVVDKNHPNYPAAKVERQTYELKSWIIAIENTGLHISYEEYFMQLVAKALQLNTYNGCTDERVVRDMIETTKARNNFDDIDETNYAEDPHTCTFRNIVSILTGESGAEMADQLKTCENAILRTRLRTTLKLIKSKSTGPEHKKLRMQLATAIKLLEAPQSIPTHS
jgi:hypothetical protein